MVIIKAKMYVKKLKNLQSEPSSCEAVNGRNSNSHQSAWHSFPVLGKVLPRDLSPLKPLLGKGEEKVSSLRGWGDVSMRDFKSSLRKSFEFLPKAQNVSFFLL